MTEDLNSAIDQQLEFLRLTKIPNELDIWKHEFTEILIRAKTGRLDEIINIREKIKTIHTALQDPHLRTSEDMYQEKLEKAPSNSPIKAALMDDGLQKIISNLVQDTLKPNVDAVIYSIQVFSPIFPHLPTH